jgi:anti-anti-sigma factor
MDNISIDTVNHFRHPNVTILRIKGFVYAATLALFEKTLQSILAASPAKKLIFDLTETNYISSGGWSLFLDNVKRARDQGGDILLVGMKPEVRDAFELMEFHKIMRLFPSLETALTEGFGKPKTPSASLP